MCLKDSRLPYGVDIAEIYWHLLPPHEHIAYSPMLQIHVEIWQEVRIHCVTKKNGERGPPLFCWRFKDLKFCSKPPSLALLHWPPYT